MALTLFNTLTREKETFTPREAGRVGMYVCVCVGVLRSFSRDYNVQLEVKGLFGMPDKRFCL